MITLATPKQQLLYEVTDPHGYLTPDVSADFSSTRLEEVERDRVSVRGAKGRVRPGTLKVSVGYVAGYIGEGEIGYTGRNALARAARGRHRSRTARRYFRRDAHRPDRKHVAARPLVR